MTNLDKIYWPKEHITKGDMLAYYEKVSSFMLPYLKNRPVMLSRYPDGINGPQFFQKDIKSHPDFIKTVTISHEKKKVRYLLVPNEKSLLWAANLGSIELHPWIMQYTHPDNPSYLVVDLDPIDLPFSVVAEVAQSIHRFLDSLKIPNYCKTSGGRGLHLYIPLHAKYSFEQTELFAKLLAQVVQNRHPDIISLERLPKNRQKKVYFDYLQNLHGGRTMVAPYSLRARPYAPVSTPLLWKEVTSKLDPLDFNIHTVPKRLEKHGDPFKQVLGKGINLKTLLHRLGSIPY